MVDGKVCNALTETTSTQKCYLCGATSKDFNNIEAMIQRPVHVDNLKLGLSILHGWIRFFECLLHVAYKMRLQKWQARTDSEKRTVAETKKEGTLPGLTQYNHDQLFFLGHANVS